MLIVIKKVIGVNRAKRIIFILSALIFSFCKLNAQDDSIPLANRQRVNTLFNKLVTEILPAPPPDTACDLNGFINSLDEASPADARYQKCWDAIEQWQDNGQLACCFRLLDAMQPFVQKNKAARLRWLYSKAMTLVANQQPDSALAIAAQLTNEADKESAFKGWAAYANAEAWLFKWQFNTTLQLAETALNKARENHDAVLEEKALSILGKTSRSIYISLPGNNVPFHQAALMIAQQLKDTGAIINELYSIALSYENTGKKDLFLDYIEQAVQLVNTRSSLKSRVNCLRIFATFLSNVSDYNRALLLDSAITGQLKILNNRTLVKSVYQQLSFIYHSRKNYGEALRMIDSSMLYADQKEYVYLQYGLIYEEQGDYKNAMKYYHLAVNNAIANYLDRNTADLTITETRLRTHEKDLLLIQQEKQRWLLFAIITMLVVLFGIAVYAYIRKKRDSEKIASQKNLIEKQAGELRLLDEAKNRFYANVSHELRTPLTLILGPLDSAVKRGQLSPTDLSYLTTAQKHSRELLTLVNEILDLSKLEAGKMQLNEGTVVFHSFIRRLASAFESHAQRLKIHFQFEYRAEKYLRLMVDADKLAKIVNNLLSNALKFTPQGGSVTLIVEDLANNMLLSVTDNGRGIHERDLPNVFDRFYQTNEPGAPVEGGTGIGLALCRELAAAMKARIWVTSEWGKGSCFYVEFAKKEVLGIGEEDDTDVAANEIAVSAETTLASDAPVLKTAQKETILLVEDNNDLRQYISNVLKQSQYDVLQAGNGVEALAILSNAGSSVVEQVQLVISDIMMPVMDGFQLLKTLKDDDILRSIPVVMLTARADMRDRLSALRIGVDDYLIKPFEEEELIARIENLLHNKYERLVPIENDRLPSALPVGEKAETSPMSKKDMEWLADLEKVVETAMVKFDFNSELVAAQLFMGRSQLFKKLKQLTGTTPNEYVQEMRLVKARTGLEKQAYTTVKEAALSVGFKDVRYFSTLFRKRFGKLPSDYLP